MRNFALLIFLISISQPMIGQKIEGIWMSYNDRIIDENNWHSNNIEGIIINFDQNEISQIASDSSFQIKINKNESLIESEFANLNSKYKLYQTDSLEVEIASNTKSVFHPLNLNHPINTSKQKIENLIAGDCWRILNDSIKTKFLNDIHPISDSNGNIKMLETIWVQSRPMVGNWFIGEIRNNFFLFLTIEDKTERNIYQIVSVEKDKINLIPLQEHHYKIREIKTCM
ncbi:hypothetical protein [Christiangramia sabulilitoris]|uniref:Uncharacterized protein n=1 Tax=Christiangramia sabulilitoris TaxID=2583991 RepID=A0A550I758_9FLAO|nr:hypothetical protein [Christiangramia sabulilitoris]TRO66806.1 hypothetical protein FGM01_02630 [Christiangramia sabulilitoris]